jgi:hypothetical protein
MGGRAFAMGGDGTDGTYETYGTYANHGSHSSHGSYSSYWPDCGVPAAPASSARGARRPLQNPSPACPFLSTARLEDSGRAGIMVGQTSLPTGRSWNQTPTLRPLKMRSIKPPAQRTRRTRLRRRSSGVVSLKADGRFSSLPRSWSFPPPCRSTCSLFRLLSSERHRSNGLSLAPPWGFWLGHSGVTRHP